MRRRVASEKAARCMCKLFADNCVFILEASCAHINCHHHHAGTLQTAFSPEVQNCSMELIRRSFLPRRSFRLIKDNTRRGKGQREEHTHANAERETQQRVVKSPCNCCQEIERGRERHKCVRCKLPNKTPVLQTRLRPSRCILYPAITRSPGAQARPRRRGTDQTSPRCRLPSRRAPPAATFRQEGSPQTQRCRC